MYTRRMNRYAEQVLAMCTLKNRRLKILRKHCNVALFYELKLNIQSQAEKETKNPSRRSENFDAGKGIY